MLGNLVRVAFRVFYLLDRVFFHLIRAFEVHDVSGYGAALKLLLKVQWGFHVPELTVASVVGGKDVTNETLLFSHLC